MKRDHATLKQRIEKLGLTHRHVANRCKIDPGTFSKILRGKDYRASDKDRIEKIHKYLDSVKT
jgi:predicted transcriptional regulator